MNNNYEKAILALQILNDVMDFYVDIVDDQIILRGNQLNVISEEEYKILNEVFNYGNWWNFKWCSPLPIRPSKRTFDIYNTWYFNFKYGFNLIFDLLDSYLS